MAASTYNHAPHLCTKTTHNNTQSTTLMHHFSIFCSILSANAHYYAIWLSGIAIAYS
ncbi:hypothetical protein QWZ13_06750 [Reinekea marina]|uniref:hypothetical protein n=1 Tax=Reinekea marina TaxID=1310421 RepID=UPI0025B4A680|nr:hypothetical protein [Reinekea marina]MDN3648609.1 hypothetical protein [Reinekea marina]